MSDLISIIVGFKNRELARVKQFITSLSNQTNKDFELLFVDYGSDLDLASTIEAYLNDIDFCNYIYHDARGKSWSRSHALNIGGVHAKGDYLYFTDIDLIFHPDYIQHLQYEKENNTHIYTRVYYLPENFSFYDELFQSNTTVLNQFEISHTSGKGILLLSKELFNQVGGYDEYYCDWGVEDNDIYIRLINNGITEKWTKNESYPVFHVWHPPAENTVKMPDKWLDDVAFYYTINQKKIVRNKDGFGKIVSIKDRKLTQFIESNEISNKITVKPKGSINTKTVFYREIWKTLEDKNGVIKITIPKYNFNYLSNIQQFIHKFIKSTLKLSNSPFSLVYTESHERETYFFPERDIRWYIRKLEKETNTILDYYIISDNEEIVVYLLS